MIIDTGSGMSKALCKGCLEKGTKNRQWSCFLWKIDGVDGFYCADCAEKILNNIYGKNKKLYEHIVLQTSGRINNKNNK